MAHVPHARYQKRAADGADSHDREQISVSLRAALKDIFDEHRNKGAQRHSQKSYAEREHGERRHGSAIADEVQTLLQAAENAVTGLHG